MLFNMLATLWGGRFSKPFCLFAVSLSLSILVGSSALTFAPTSAYAEEQTGEATTEVYLVKTDDGATPSTTTTTTTITTTDNPSTTTTTKTGDTTPVVPLVVAGIVMAAVSIVAARKLATIGGENL